MGKYGKKFRKIQLEEWKEKYFNFYFALITKYMIIIKIFIIYKI